MNTFRVGRSLLLTLLIGSALVTSCKKDADTVTPATTTTTSPTSATTTDVNNWILDNMKYAYYWTDKIPANPDKSLEPSAFFQSLLYKYDRVLRPDGDRYSWISNNAETLQASLGGQSLSTGAEFRLYRRAANSNDVIAVVLYTERGSPAEKAGIKRGDIIYAVNGQTITTTNYADLLFGTSTSQTFGLATIQNGALTNTNQTKSSSAITLQTNPVYLDSVYTVNARKIGYLVYNQFIKGAYNSSTDEYNQALDRIFTKFKNQGINELILDLRYNPGGGGDVATNLASYIAPGASPAKVFFTQQYNPTVTADLQKQYGANFNVSNFTTKAANLSNLNRLFVLTTDNTASASELVINGLKPYMNVTIVGDTTSGKNVGSTTITDKTGKIKWGIQPIIVKAFNSAGQSDYTNGFAPNSVLFEQLPYKALGDVSEPLLSQAIFLISGSRPARLGVQSGLLLPSIGSSVERKSGGSTMFFDNKLPVLP
jgi:C-terminal processing protease CtpA/Prc